jgi:hypothetical protein
MAGWNGWQVAEKASNLKEKVKTKKPNLRSRYVHRVLPLTFCILPSGRYFSAACEAASLIVALPARGQDLQGISQLLQTRSNFGHLCLNVPEALEMVFQRLPGGAD